MTAPSPRNCPPGWKRHDGEKLAYYVTLRTMRQLVDRLTGFIERGHSPGMTVLPLGDLARAVETLQRIAREEIERTTRTTGTTGPEKEANE